MTDADVDGSHIRTLLLTFFYRHMFELLQHHYLYIAQPPLFKLSKKNTGHYFKDQESLDAFLLKTSAETTTVHLPGGESCTGDTMLAFCKKVMDLHRYRQKMEKKYDLRVIDALAHLSKTHNPPEWTVEDYQKYLTEVLQEHDPGALPLEVEQTEMGSFCLKTRNMGAIAYTYIQSQDYQSELLGYYCKAYREFTYPIWGQYEVEHQGERLSLGKVWDLVGAVLDRSRSGWNIQRYKGLGEMNPEQLWETTMNPENRTLLRVHIDDAIKADSIFTVLMGDQVEPRRDFIEKFALDVRHLDI
jgi:DNA gyrase subunit B